MEKPDTTGHERERGHERELGNELKCDYVLNVTGNLAHNYYTTKPKTLKPSPNGAQYGPNGAQYSPNSAQYGPNSAQYGDQPKYSPPHDP